MNSSNKYLKARKDLLKTIYDDLVGPESEFEIISDSPSSRYSAGAIFPREQADEDGHQEAVVEKSLEAGDDRPIDEEEADGLIEQTSSFFPSAMGLSFIVDKSSKNLKVNFSAGKYRRISDEDFPVSVPAGNIKNFPNDAFFNDLIEYKEKRLILKRNIFNEEKDKLIELVHDNSALKNSIYRLTKNAESGWKRIPVKAEIYINPEDKYIKHKIQGEHVSIISTSKQDTDNGKLVCNVTVINEEMAVRQQDNEKTYYQAYLAVEDPELKPRFHAFNEKVYSDGSEAEEKSLQLLYRKKAFFAAGHGTSASWQINSSGNLAVKINTDNLPGYIIPEINFELSALENELPDLSMRHFAEDKKVNVIKSMKALHHLYAEWISGLEKEMKNLSSDLKQAASNNIGYCLQALSRIERGILLIEKNENVKRCFRLANKAMLMQRVHSKAQDTRHYPDENYRPVYDYKTDVHVWRPFQLAFILMNLEAIANPESVDRDIVDLIWFPTGGGKTEAYLGLTAFTIFMRRLNNKSGSGGTTVLMRYTLRLLTSQQFQRACTLICACEKLRLEGECTGDPITIGQWLGLASSPNTIIGAEQKLRDLQRQRDGSGMNPFQILHCPWCGTHIIRKGGRGTFCYRIRTNPKRFTMWCANKFCDFHNELPIKIIDEDIYREPPTLLFGTVDKFAMLAWKADASSIFALNQGNKNNSPELIIQDELHLISGSLGTMVGLYETSIDLLCGAKGKRPKIIASTATIRRSKDQCNALYAREVRQFPPSGLDASDSFFAKEAEISDEKPGRLYIGVMPSGKTSTTMEIRLLADCIQGVDLLEDEVKDKFWTQVVYCNSIRELGTSKSIIYDDVKEYSKRLSDRLGVKPRYYSDKAVEELTGRVSAELIPEILQKLEIEYPDKNAVDVLLATNMISVGVDINRLGLMVVLGQPKTTSEYIQASSRVGRKYPGMVLTLYSPVKSRDRSHFEQFIKYHQSLYRYVEPTSVTPFSSPVRDKALHAVLLILIRHMLGYAKNESLPGFDPKSNETNQIVSKIIKRVNIVDSAEASATKAELEAILNRINELKNLDPGISYDEIRNSMKIPLLRRPGDKTRGIFSTPQSMRSTDAECYVTIDYS